MEKKILIIGENSYIGNSFAEYVKARSGELEEGLSLQVSKVSARDNKWKSEDLGQYDVILHVAAIVHQKKTSDKQQLYIDINEKLPVEIAKQAKEAGVSQFIFLSTMAVYGEVEGAITAITPLEPVTMYGKTKLAAEKRLEKLANEQFKITILRPPMVYGEECPGNYTRLKKLAKVLPIFPDVDNKRSMIHIDRLCQCIMEVVVCNTSGQKEILHPQDNCLVKTTDMYVALRKELGKKTWTTKVFNGLIWIMKSKVGAVRKLFGSCYYEI